MVACDRVGWHVTGGGVARQSQAGGDNRSHGGDHQASHARDVTHETRKFWPHPHGTSSPWFLIPMVPYPHGSSSLCTSSPWFFIPVYLIPMVSHSYGTSYPWFLAPMAPHPYGISSPLFLIPMVTHPHGTSSLWNLIPIKKKIKIALQTTFLSVFSLR